MSDEQEINPRDRGLWRLCLLAMRRRVGDHMKAQPIEIEKEYSQQEIAEALDVLKDSGAARPHPRYHPDVNESANILPKLWILTDKGERLLEILERDQ